MVFCRWCSATAVPGGGCSEFVCESVWEYTLVCIYWTPGIERGRSFGSWTTPPESSLINLIFLIEILTRTFSNQFRSFFPFIVFLSSSFIFQANIFLLHYFLFLFFFSLLSSFLSFFLSWIYRRVSVPSPRRAIFISIHQRFRIIFLLIVPFSFSIFYFLLNLSIIVRIYLPEDLSSLVYQNVKRVNIGMNS